jgi:hypothetical protein
MSLGSPRFSLEKTPHIFELYKRLYDNPVKLLKAPRISLSQEDLVKTMGAGGLDGIFEKIKTDDEFVRRNKLKSVRE